ncbi:hypothetical protein EDD55_10560 [Varunaivibrio sulfuroxidans]|uniref:Uncharacterized protein n=2 Tax=Varunaivibrio sulfuroxidans TaxID=1773489 RepID=A0A4R3JAZ0_9PROT|nr:hypothetical protein EDD55_10560 [Varunaivibrio sulfuroxidans]
MAEKTQAPPQNSKKKGPSQTTLWLIFILVIVMIISLPSVIVFTFGMIPSFVAYIIDRTKSRSATFCVSSINFIGVFPFIIDLWVKEHTISAALNTISNVFSIFVMYAASAFGWMLFLSLPPVVASVVTILNEHKIEQLRATQKQIIKEWGNDVTSKVQQATQVPHSPRTSPPPA